jgi:hypothetical protein
MKPLIASQDLYPSQLMHHNINKILSSKEQIEVIYNVMEQGYTFKPTKKDMTEKQVIGKNCTLAWINLSIKSHLLISLPGQPNQTRSN